MCGIAGIIRFGGNAIDKADLEKMSRAIAHRGPDGESIFLDGHVGLAHRRLSIFDPDTRSNQPFSGWGKTMVYNGAIYNYPELRKELESLGYPFKTTSDTEVLLAAYDCWGEEIHQRLNGMWALAIYDPGNKQVFLSRDRFGEKPIYYFQRKEQFVFASTISALKVKLDSIEPEEKMVARYLAFEHCEDPELTFYKDIFKLKAGHFARIDINTGTLKLQKYYEPFQTDIYQDISLEDAKNQLGSLIERSVQLRLRSDVPIGGCLSGGLDSSAIAYAVTKQLDNGTPEKEFRTVTAITDDPLTNEKDFADLVASNLGLNAIHTKVGLDELQEDFQNMLRFQEQPVKSASPFMQYAVMKAANSYGLKVMLDGQGADELLLGYPMHLAWYFKQLGILNKVREASALMRNNSFSSKQFAVLNLYHGNQQLKNKRQLIRWADLDADSIKYLREFANSERKKNSNSIFDKQVNELTNGSLPSLLRFEDCNAMAFGIETRLPFLDWQLVEFALNIPIGLKVDKGWSKFILRKYLDQKLPDQIVWRKRKIGFQAPAAFENYLAGHLKSGWKKSQLLSGLIRNAQFDQLDHHQQLRLAILSLWEQQL